MACGGMPKRVQKRLNAYSATAAQEWFTEWLPAIGLDDVMIVFRARQATSAYFEGQLIMQTASVRTDQPNAISNVGSGQTSNGTGNSFTYNTGVLDISASTAPVMWVRFGVAYKYSTAQAQASADVDVEVSYKQCGDMAGAATHQLSTTTVDDQFVAITPFLPGILVDGVKAALIINSLTGNFRCRLAYRLAATSKEQPGTWTAVTDANAPYTGGEVCTGDLAVTVGSNMWIQFGILYDLSSTGTGQASVSAAVGTRRA
jgi:hypothetical protein